MQGPAQGSCERRALRQTESIERKLETRAWYSNANTSIGENLYMHRRPLKINTKWAKANHTVPLPLTLGSQISISSGASSGVISLSNSTGRGHSQLSNNKKNLATSVDATALGYSWQVRATSIAQDTPPRKPSLLLYTPRPAAPTHKRIPMPYKTDSTY